MLRLLHLSDIHFETPNCLNPDIDPDAGLRSVMVNCILDFTRTSQKSIDGVLITGDIAYKADPEEFSVAEDWIKELASKLGISIEQIFVTPGNHDVNRAYSESISY